MIDFALENEGANIFAAPGLGKTLAALETIKATDARTLVVAPLLVAAKTWPAENKKWGYDFDMRLLHGRGLHLNGNEHVSLINYEGLPKLASLLGTKSQKREFPFEYIIYDEVSMMKNAGSKRFGRWRHQMSRFDYRLGLTGTPSGNSLIGLWGQQYCADLGESLGNSVEKYRKRHFDELYEGGWMIREGAEQEILKAIAPRARSYDTDLLDMPELISNVIEVDLPEKAMPWYTEMCEESTIEALDMIAVNSGVKAIKKRQIAGGAMYDNDGNIVRLHDAKKAPLKNIVNELQGDPLLIVYGFNHSIDPIKECCDDVAFINGNTKPWEGAEIIDQWNAGQLQALAIHPASAARGLNIQESGSTICFYDTPWSFELMLQSLMRIWRQGQKRKVIAHYIAVSGTIETEVLDTADRNNQQHKRLMEALTPDTY